MKKVTLTNVNSHTYKKSNKSIKRAWISYGKTKDLFEMVGLFKSVKFFSKSI